MREALEERHAGEQHAERDEGRCERARVPLSKRRPGDRNDERREREQEEEQLDASLPEILRPEQRESGEEEETRRRHGEDALERATDVTAKRADEEGEQRRRKDDVERHQEVRLLSADARRDPKRRRREQDDRDAVGIARERDSGGRDEQGAEHERRKMRCRPDEELKIAPRNQCDGEQRLSRRGNAEADEQLAARAREQQDRRRQGADNCRKLSQVAVRHEERRLRDGF